jgi:two-component system, NarL family, sensor histidine kinase UhpB
MLKRIAWLLLITCALVAAGCGAADLPGGAGSVSLSSALTVDGNDEAFPGGKPARTVTLPDSWSLTRPDSQGPVWYRVTFTLPAPETLPAQAALIERACGRLELHLNGQRLQSAAGPTHMVTQECNHPRLVGLPPGLLKAGVNVLDLKLSGLPLDRVASRQRAAALSAIELGAQDTLAVKQAKGAMWQAGVAQSISIGLGFLGAFMLLQGLRHRRDSHVNYFGGLALAQSALYLPQWLPHLTVDSLVIEFCVASLMPLATWAAVQFLLRYAGRRERSADLVLPAQCVLMPLSLILLGPTNLHVATQFWATLFVIEILAAAGLHLSTQWPDSRRAFWVMLALLIAVAVGELIGFYGLHADEPALASAGHAVLPTLTMLLGLRLIQQRSRALESVEASRVLLEQRVAEVKAEIEANYRQLSELRVVQVTDRERKRIAADLHDDLGAKLLTIVHTSESERISTLAREALEEMRLSVRGLTGKPVRLEDALGDWRAEVISRLGQAGIEAVWTMPTEDLPHTLPARAFVQTTRIVREAVNNIIKHSGASQCAVRCNVAEGDFQLVIQDNGKGISVEVDGRLDRGHGLSSMKGRAKQLQGQCLVESGPGYGTVIRLTIPLESAGHAA